MVWRGRDKRGRYRRGNEREIEEGRCEDIILCFSITLN
jgi:hypothetical protein